MTAISRQPLRSWASHFSLDSSSATTGKDFAMNDTLYCIVSCCTCLAVSRNFYMLYWYFGKLITWSKPKNILSSSNASRPASAWKNACSRY